MDYVLFASIVPTLSTFVFRPLQNCRAVSIPTVGFKRYEDERNHSATGWGRERWWLG